MAESQKLYPVFEIPAMQASDDTEEQVFLPAPLFDFDTGDFVRDGENRVVMVNGRDAFMLWVLKTLQTQAGACQSYYGCGIDVEACLMEPTRDAVQSALERTISEALLSNPHVDRVYNFEYLWKGNELTTSFIIKPKSWEAFDVGMTVVT